MFPGNTKILDYVLIKYLDIMDSIIYIGLLGRKSSRLNWKSSRLGIESSGLGIESSGLVWKSWRLGLERKSLRKLLLRGLRISASHSFRRKHGGRKPTRSKCTGRKSIRGKSSRRKFASLRKCRVSISKTVLGRKGLRESAGLGKNSRLGFGV